MAEQNAQQRRKTGSAKPKTGQYRKGKTERWNGTKWVKVNVVHAGQKATLGGKSVTADGSGNWRTKGDSRGRVGKSQGRYAPGERVTTTPLKPIPASKRPKDMQAGKVYGDAGQPKAPTLPPKPTPTKSAPSTRKNVTPTPTSPKKVKAKTVSEGRMTWARKYSGEKYKGTAIGKEAKAYLTKQEKKKQITKAQTSTGTNVLRKTNNKIG
jgi:hypothetical protein